MARYIDTDLLIENIAKNDLRRLTTKTIGEAISNTPTADVVEVVRCKDCESYLEYTFCEHMGLNGFCSYGERKQND